jgi:hypothetical protein
MIECARRASGTERNIQLKRGPLPKNAANDMRDGCAADAHFLMRYRFAT